MWSFGQSGWVQIRFLVDIRLSQKDCPAPRAGHSLHLEILPLPPSYGARRERRGSGKSFASDSGARRCPIRFISPILQFAPGSEGARQSQGMPVGSESAGPFRCGTIACGKPESFDLHGSCRMERSRNRHGSVIFGAGSDCYFHSSLQRSAGVGDCVRVAPVATLWGLSRENVLSQNGLTLELPHVFCIEIIWVRDEQRSRCRTLETSTGPDLLHRRQEIVSELHSDLPSVECALAVAP
jgi:hypothetical protein